MTFSKVGRSRRDRRGSHGVRTLPIIPNFNANKSLQHNTSTINMDYFYQSDATDKTDF